MHSVNGRGTYLCSAKALPYLKQSAAGNRNPHILNISPPLDMNPKWFAAHPAYTAAKYNMSMFALGMAAELKSDGISVNCLWPRTGIATAAINMLMGEQGMSTSRSPEIMADAALEIIKTPQLSGNFFVDDALLLERGWTPRDIAKYNPNGDPNAELQPDFFLDGVEEWLADLRKGVNPSAKL